MPRSTRPSQVTPLQALGLGIMADAKDDDEEDVGLLVVYLGLTQKKGGKWGPRAPYHKDTASRFLTLLLEDFSDKLFKAFCRMSRQAFWHVHNLIKDAPIFQSNGKRPQRAVKFQLVAFLVKFGGTSSIRAAGILAMSEGTISMYSRRVSSALRKLRSEHLAWPGPVRKDFLKTEMAKYGFPGCLGMVDGSLIRLQEKPRNNGWAYFSRKKFYALLVQAVVDHRAIFLDFELGWPGSVADTMCFKECELWRNRQKYFAEDEYILADKGYPLTKYTIRPFTEHDLTNDPQEASARRHWNRELSHLRVKVEHAFGLLKGRFPSLRAFPGKDLKRMWYDIEALLVLHNILQEFGDDPYDIEGFNGLEDIGLEAAEVHEDEFMRGRRRHLGDEELYQTGLLRRKRLVNLFHSHI